MFHTSKQDRINVFEDTRKLYESNEVLKKSIHDSKSRQVVVSEEETVCIENNLMRYETPAQVIVSKKRSFEAAKEYTGRKVCVLNFASATNPGGGVVKGASAQEEALCRCSSLYPCISDPEVVNKFHRKHRNDLKDGKMTPLYNDDCIYTPDVIVCKYDTNNPERMPESEWYKSDVISCAAPNLRAKPSNAMNPGSGNKAARLKSNELMNLHMKRMRRILDIAALHGAEVIILGAFGCGAFQNPPAVVAEAMARVIKEYDHTFETIEFAVYCTPYDLTNYDVFKRRFGGK